MMTWPVQLLLPCALGSSAELPLAALWHRVFGEAPLANGSLRVRTDRARHLLDVGLA